MTEAVVESHTNKKTLRLGHRADPRGMIASGRVPSGLDVPPVPGAVLRTEVPAEVEQIKKAVRAPNSPSDQVTIEIDGVVQL